LSAEIVPTTSEMLDEEDRRNPQLEGGAQPFADRLRHRLASSDRATEVTLNGPPEPQPILDRPRLIQPERGPDLLKLLRIALLACVRQDRIARGHPDQHEDDDRHEECDGHHQHDAPQDVLSHGAAA